jgi:oxygen-independent coproporphyrinogen III oxidase
MPGVYLSFPFCAQKCTYCNFASGVFPAELEGRYHQVLRQELSATAWPWTPNTVYLGGGTPSQIGNDDLAALLDRIPGRPWAEATLEAAPGSFSRSQVAAWREAGINRVSLGVQSFVEAELRRTGRKHTAAIVADDVALLRSEGISNINLDLIAGLAGQTPASWETSLDWIERLAPPHASVYMLEVDEDSRLGLEILNNGPKYGARDIPDDDAIAAMYERAVERFAAIGLPRYEISNFGQPSLHNLKYWHLDEYLGFGADAHSNAAGRRWQNPETALAYVESGPRREDESAANPASERFFVGLRLSEGVAPQPAEWTQWAEPIARFLSDGLLEHHGDRLRLSPRGVLLSNDVLQEFL